MNEDWEKTPLQRAFHPIVSHRAFNLIFGVLIIANAISIGAEVLCIGKGATSKPDRSCRASLDKLLNGFNFNLARVWDLTERLIPSAIESGLELRL
eukprot:5162556-Amphidinium_carterae.1